ncbi:MAG: SpoIIE family protein phosphatase [Verrucomicrobia bacterium]|nr:SpoIIE family protein phosphatase [Verrucomicrobiota bacterium]
MQTARNAPGGFVGMQGTCQIPEKDSSCRTVENRLHSGDAVALYTDGLYEVARDSGEDDTAFFLTQS